MRCRSWLHFLPEGGEAEGFRPVLDVGQIAAGGDEIADVAKLLVRPGIAGPVEFGDDEVLFADDPGGEIFDGDLLTALKLGETVGAVFADDEVHFNDTVLVEEVEHESPGDGIAD